MTKDKFIWRDPLDSEEAKQMEEDNVVFFRPSAQMAELSAVAICLELLYQQGCPNSHEETIADLSVTQLT